jgi:hypothetical protein
MGTVKEMARWISLAAVAGYVEPLVAVSKAVY